MTEEQLIRRIKRQAPQNIDCLLERCKLSLRYIDSGAFRKVYKILGARLVAKVPLNVTEIEHAKAEYKAWSKVMRSKRYETLRKFMPEVFYYNEASGLTLMREYRPVPGTPKNYRAMNAVNDEVAALLGTVDSDLGGEKPDNYGLDRNGKLKVIDLAFLFGS